MVNFCANRSAVVLVLLVTILAGCSTTSALVKDGPGINFSPEEVQKYAADQDKVLQHLYALAGVPKTGPLGSGPGDWDTVIRAGLDYADQKCEAYMHALFRLNRDKM